MNSYPLLAQSPTYQETFNSLKQQIEESNPLIIDEVINIIFEKFINNGTPKEITALFIDNIEIENLPGFLPVPNFKELLKKEVAPTLLLDLFKVEQPICKITPFENRVIMHLVKKMANESSKQLAEIQRIFIFNLGPLQAKIAKMKMEVHTIALNSLKNLKQSCSDLNQAVQTLNDSLDLLNLLIDDLSSTSAN